MSNQMTMILAVVGVFIAISECILIVSWLPGYYNALDEAKDGNLDPAVDLLVNMTEDLVPEPEEVAIDILIDSSIDD